MEQNNNCKNDGNDDRGSSPTGVGGSRWNPTKEQIEILEKYYSEGLRTPSADEIQKITSRLRVFGQIEGKNVFYWFQNHKARQRQKQRQELLAAASHQQHNNTFLTSNHLPNYHHNFNFNHHYHLTNPVVNLNLSPKPGFIAPSAYNLHHQNQYLPTSTNGICNPYYQHPRTNVGFYPTRAPQHNYGAPATNDHFNKRVHHRRSKVASLGDQGVPPGSTLSGYCAMMMMNNYNTPKSSSLCDDHHNDVHCRCMGTRTLNLFPVHPTGILEHKLASSKNNSGNSSDDDTCTDDIGSCQPGTESMFDFFSSGRNSSTQIYHH